MPGDELARHGYQQQFATLKTFRPTWQIAQFCCQVAQTLLLAVITATLLVQGR